MNQIPAPSITQWAKLPLWLRLYIVVIVFLRSI